MAEHTQKHVHGELETEAVHQHVLEDGTVIEHSHMHGHTHTHQNTKAVLNRLSRAIGHLESIKRMVESRTGLQRGADPAIGCKVGNQ